MNEKLALIRAALKENSIDVHIIPLSDPHLGEYIPAHWKIIQWLTGFTGSAATVVISDSFAGLWTDSRYYIQAEKQLAGSEFKLIKPGPFQTSDYTDWLYENLSAGSTIGFDGIIFSIREYRKLEKHLEGKNLKFVPDFDPVSDCWSGRPSMPSSMAWDYPAEYAGKERSSKMAGVREKMKDQDIDYHLLTSVDDIMWLLNIRGNDVDFSPLLTCFALLDRRQMLLFVDERKIPLTLAREFDKLGIVTLPYEETAGMISVLSEGSSILITPSTTSLALFKSIPEKFRIVEDISIPARLKAIKNKTEIRNISAVMLKDGIALSKFFFFIEHNIGIVPMTEVSLAVKLQEIRSYDKDYLGPSFATITAYKEHAALPHYSPDSENDKEIGEDGILLVDSGGQYLGGTTDITRTISTGIPTLQQKMDFTLVLKGHIGLARAKFPHGTRGYQLDILARKALWENGLNYGHGTGHGVGFCLNVHEGPQSISPSDNKTVIEPGMLISNEPAVYREGAYGIRIENLVICFEDEETDFGKFLKFDTLSLCYIDTELIDKSLLDHGEIAWLNKYNSDVYDKLSSHLLNDEKLWLKQKTLPI
jgi:Xaa-Pro aminopeptidase